MKNNIIKTNDYKQFIQNIKQTIQTSQIKAAISVNRELLNLYWNLAKQIVEKQKQAAWGDGFIKQMSIDLQAEFTDMKGFSERNIKYIRQWFLFYNSKNTIGQQVVAQLIQIPWGHNIAIISKCKHSDEAIFYVQKTIQNNWSRAVLTHQIESNVYARDGKAITNFQSTLPEPQSDLARQTLKDPYNFDFLTIREKHDEKELEDALVDHVTKFLLELGVGFSYIGRQQRLEVGGDEFFIDLLFYHVKLHSYIVLELKAVKFKPEFAGKLNFYVSAVDGILKSEQDNPTIGILICKSKNDTVVEYALKDIHKPIGVSEYTITKNLPDEFKSSLPSIEEIEAELGGEMSEWKEWKLEEIYDFASGLSKSRNEFGFGYEFLSFKDVFNNFFVPDKLTQLANTTEQERKRCSVKKGDVFLTRTSETQEELGMSSVALKDYPNATFNGFTKRLRPKDLSIILPEYAGFYFRSPHFRALVTSMASITTRASLNNGMLSDLTIVIPPMEIQKAIASLLSSLDDKIDLLHQQNKTLEAMAETLFRQWFVEEAKDDWEEVELEYVTTRITDGAHKSPATVEIGLPMASVKDMHDWGIDINSCRKIAEHDFHELVRNDCRPLKNDIVIAKDGSYLKHVFVAHEDLDVVILSSIAIIRPNEIYDPILLSTYLKLDSTRLALENIVTGAVIPRIVLKDFRRFPIPLPPKELQKKALVVIEPLIKKCWYNISHIHTLEKLRDTLLPKLMNGEVKINF